MVKTVTDAECARLILETFPRAMRTLAHDMRDVPGATGTMPQYRILAQLHLRGPISMGELAERQGVTLPTMTKIVSGLVERGQVERETDERDRRVVRLRLTSDGETLFRDMHRRMESRLAALIRQMNEEERVALAEGLRGFHRVLSDAAPRDETGEQRAGRC